MIQTDRDIELGRTSFRLDYYLCFFFAIYTCHFGGVSSDFCRSAVLSIRHIFVSSIPIKESVLPFKVAHFKLIFLFPRFIIIRLSNINYKYQFSNLSIYIYIYHVISLYWPDKNLFRRFFLNATFVNFTKIRTHLFIFLLLRKNGIFRLLLVTGLKM